MKVLVFPILFCFGLLLFSSVDESASSSSIYFPVEQVFDGTFGKNVLDLFLLEYPKIEFGEGSNISKRILYKLMRGRLSIEEALTLAVDSAVNVTFFTQGLLDKISIDEEFKKYLKALLGSFEELSLPDAGAICSDPSQWLSQEHERFNNRGVSQEDLRIESIKKAIKKKGSDTLFVKGSYELLSDRLDKFSSVNDVFGRRCSALQEILKFRKDVISVNEVRDIKNLKQKLLSFVERIFDIFLRREFDLLIIVILYQKLQVAFLSEDGSSVFPKIFIEILEKVMNERLTSTDIVDQFLIKNNNLKDDFSKKLVLHLFLKEKGVFEAKCLIPDVCSYQLPDVTSFLKKCMNHPGRFICSNCYSTLTTKVCPECRSEMDNCSSEKIRCQLCMSTHEIFVRGNNQDFACKACWIVIYEMFAGSLNHDCLNNEHQQSTDVKTVLEKGFNTTKGAIKSFGAKIKEGFRKT